MKYAAAVLALAACGSDAPTVFFDAKHDTAETFWNAPWPSDTRLDANGAPDITGFPNPRNVPILASLLSDVPERHGWPMMSIAYIRFTAAPAATDGKAYLVDIEQKTTVPIVVQVLPADRYATSNLVALAPVPGFVLRGDAKYAYVIAKDFAPGFDSPARLEDVGGPRRRAADPEGRRARLDGVHDWRRGRARREALRCDPRPVSPDDRQPDARRRRHARRLLPGSAARSRCRSSRPARSRSTRRRVRARRQ